MALSAAVAAKQPAGSPAPSKSSPIKFVDGGNPWVLMAISAQTLREGGVDVDQHMLIYKVDGGKAVDPKQVPKSVLQRAREALVRKGDPEKQLSTAVLPDSMAQLQMLLLQHPLP